MVLGGTRKSPASCAQPPPPQYPHHCQRTIHPVQALMTTEKKRHSSHTSFVVPRKYLHLVDATRSRYVEALGRVPHHVLSHRHLSTPHWQSHILCAGSDDDQSTFCRILVIPRNSFGECKQQQILVLGSTTKSPTPFAQPPPPQYSPLAEPYTLCPGSDDDD